MLCYRGAPEVSVHTVDEGASKCANVEVCGVIGIPRKSIDVMMFTERPVSEYMERTVMDVLEDPPLTKCEERVSRRARMHSPHSSIYFAFK